MVENLESDHPGMKQELEFYLVRIYRNPQGWRVSFFEIQNFTNNVGWCALFVSWAPTELCDDEHDQKKLTVSWFQ